MEGNRSVPAAERFGYRNDWGLPGEADRAALPGIMRELAETRPDARERETSTAPGEPLRRPDSEVHRQLPAASREIRSGAAHRPLNQDTSVPGR